MGFLQRNRTVIIISLITIVFGIVVMTGWICHIPSLENIVTGHIATRFNAALCFFLFGSALLLSQYHSKKYNHFGFVILSLLGTLIGLLTIYQELFHVNIGIDQLFVIDKTGPSVAIPFAGRMAFTASFNFSLLGLGLLLLINKRKPFLITAQYIFHFVALISGIALIGNLFGVELFRSLLYVSSMANATAILFFILSIAASLLNPALGLTGLFTGQRVGNQMARRLFTLIILMIIIFGSLRKEDGSSQLFSSINIGMSVLAVAFLLVSLLLIWNTANWLNKIDDKRTEAEAKVKLLNTELEKRVEERSAELNEVELKFRTIAEKSMVGVYIVQNDMFTYVNPRFAQIFGLEPAELLNDPEAGVKIFDETYLAIVKENIRLRIEGEVESIRYIARGKKKDGTSNWVEIYGNRVIIGGKPAIIGSAIDITERKKAEGELKSSEQKYKLLFESNPVPMWMIDKEKLTIIAANDAAAKHYGYTKDELIGMNVKLFRPKEDAENNWQAIKWKWMALPG